MTISTDRIEQQVLLHAPLQRLWRALTDPDAVGAWFGMASNGTFVAGQPVTGRIMPTQVGPEVARLQTPHAGTPFKRLIATLCAGDALSIAPRTPAPPSPATRPCWPMLAWSTICGAAACGCGHSNRRGWSRRARRWTRSTPNGLACLQRFVEG